MGGLSFWHILLLAAVVLLLFGGGRGKVSDFMGDFAKGIRNFKKGLTEDEPPPPPPPPPPALPREEHDVVRDKDKAAP